MVPTLSKIVKILNSFLKTGIFVLQNIKIEVKLVLNINSVKNGFWKVRMLTIKRILTIYATLILMLLLIVNATTAKYALAELTENRQINIFHTACLMVSSEAPQYVNASESFDLTLIFHADANLSDIKFSLELVTFANDTEFIFQKFSGNINELIEKNECLRTFSVIAPPNASRIIEGRMNCSWIIKTGTPHPVTYASGFVVSVITDPWRKIAERLERELNETKTERDYWKREYENLNATYTDLNATYTEETSKLQGEIGTTRQLAVILGVTTVFFGLTTLYLFRRRPSEVW